MSRVLLVATCAACASVSERELDTSTATVVTVSDNNGVVKVDAPSYSLALASPGNVFMPVQLAFAGSMDNLLRTGACAAPSSVGVAVFPVASATGQTKLGSGITSDHRLVFGGGAVVKLEVSFEVPYVCANEPRRFGGTSSFTFYPSGRIVRNDLALSPTDREVTRSLDCTACTGPPPVLDFHSFWAFKNPLQDVDAQGQPGPKTNGGCSIFMDGVIALAPEPAATFETGIDGEYVAAWRQSEGTILDIAATYGLTTEVVVSNTAPGASECAKLLENTRRFELRVNGAVVAQNLDGMFTVSGEQTGRIELAPEQGSIDVGFAVKLELDGSEHVKVQRVSGAAPDALVQYEGSHVIFWFGSGLAAGDSILLDIL